MNNKRTRVIALVAAGTLVLVALLLVATGVWAMPDAHALAGPLAQASVVSGTLTYQGQLLDSEGEPLDGTYEMTFRLYDVPTGGTALWTQVQNVEVEDGLFTAYLDVDTALFNGQALWLGVQMAGDTEMLPRQPLLPAPYALALPGLRTQQNATSPNIIGGYGGNSVGVGVVGAVIGGGGDSVYPNQVTANYGTVGGGGGNFVSAMDGTIGGGFWNATSGAGATVSGGAVNVASGKYATIGGGGGYYNSTPLPNTASGDWSTVGGGAYNLASGGDATVGGGYDNIASGDGATIGGGYSNEASGGHAVLGGGDSNTASGWNATLGGGYQNTAGGNSATIGGGDFNTSGGGWSIIGGGVGNTASGKTATIGGGRDNTASSDYATVGGGYWNHADALTATIGGGEHISVTGQAATVAGGSYITAGGDYATVPGGVNNTASGDYSFAAGQDAQAVHDGSFVWSSWNPTSSWGDNTFTAAADGGARFWSGISTGVQLSSGGTAWGSISDRNAKENFSDVDAGQVLETLAGMPIQTWNLKAQSPNMRHIGPMAQDFNGEFAYLFGEVESPTHINNMDAIGVALVAIQGLYAQNQELAVENTTLQQQVDDLETRMAALEAAVGTSQSLGFGIFRGWLSPDRLGTLLVGGLVAVVVVVRRRRSPGGGL